MSLFQSLGKAPQQGQQQITPQQAWQQFRQDPVAALRQAGLNVPDGMTDPQQITQHLVQSGQVPQNRFAQAMQMMMGRR